MADAIRERALEAIVWLFETMEEGVPASDSYDLTFNDVVRHPLGDRERNMDYALAIVENDEVKERGFGWMQATLSLDLQFHAILETEESGPHVLNAILLNIQRRIRSDPRLAGAQAGHWPPLATDPALIIDMFETGNVVDVDSYADKLLSGSVFVDLRYKHAEHDPRLVAPTQL